MGVSSGLVCLLDLGIIRHQFFLRGLIMAGLNDSGIPQITLPSSGGAGGGAGRGGFEGGGFTSNKDLMTQARESLSGNWGWGIIGYILYTALSLAITFFIMAAGFFVGVVSGLSGGNAEAAGGAVSAAAQLVQLALAGPLIVGFYGFFLGIAQDDEGRLDLLFVGFRRFWKSFLGYLIFCLILVAYVAIPLLPLYFVAEFVGSLKNIIASEAFEVAILTLVALFASLLCFLQFSMTFFVISDDEACGPLEAITRSKRMMKGNKWKLFCLSLRFIGWAILALMTFGIGFLWLVPYIQTSLAKFYEDVK